MYVGLDRYMEVISMTGRRIFDPPRLNGSLAAVLKLRVAMLIGEERAIGEAE